MKFNRLQPVIHTITGKVYKFIDYDIDNQAVCTDIQGIHIFDNKFLFPERLSDSYDEIVVNDGLGLVGQNFDKMRLAVQIFNIQLRCVEKDGFGVTVSCEYSSSRINVAVNEGIITSIESIG